MSSSRWFCVESPSVRFHTWSKCSKLPLLLQVQLVGGTVYPVDVDSKKSKNKTRQPPRSQLINLSPFCGRLSQEGGSVSPAANTYWRTCTEYEVLHAGRPNPTRLEREKICCLIQGFTSPPVAVGSLLKASKACCADTISLDPGELRIFFPASQFSAEPGNCFGSVSRLFSHNLLPDICVSDGRVPKGRQPQPKIFW